MEDQQPAAGDLSADGEPGPAASVDDEQRRPGDGEADTAVAGENVADETAAEDVEADHIDSADDAETQDTGDVPRGRQPVRRWLGILAAAAALLFVASAAFAGAAVAPYLRDRADSAVKLQVARTAADAITTLWTYTPANMDKLPDRAAQYLSGDFEAQYRKYIDAIIAPNRQAQIANTTQVVGAAVESLHGTEATAIVYTNTTSTSPATKEIPAIRYLSYRLAMKRNAARWLVTRMTTITSLDLRPQL